MAHHHPQGRAGVSRRLNHLLRRMGRLVTGGLVAGGACWYGGYATYVAWTSRGAPFVPCDHDRHVTREAVRGISEIEQFVADHADPASPGSGPGNRASQRE